MEVISLSESDSSVIEISGCGIHWAGSFSSLFFFEGFLFMFFCFFAFLSTFGFSLGVFDLGVFL